jgi:hypothetical protein
MSEAVVFVRCSGTVAPAAASLHVFGRRGLDGGRRKLVAAVQDRAEVERFLKHLELWKLPADIVAIRGPPAELFPAEPIPEDEGDGRDRVDGDWAA